MPLPGFLGSRDKMVWLDADARARSRFLAIRRELPQNRARTRALSALSKGLNGSENGRYADRNTGLIFPIVGLAGVADDAAELVTRRCAGRDLAATTATQVVLQRLLGIATPRYATPRYRHHVLLLERRGEKLAKLHGAVGFAELCGVYSTPALCGVLAHAAGLVPSPEAVTPRELLGEFAWNGVRAEHRVLH